MIVNQADEHTGLAGHSGVDGVRAKPLAVNRVVGIGGRGANDVAGVDVPDVHLDAAAFEILGDFCFEEDADVAVNLIAGSVDAAGVGYQILSGAFGDEDDGVVTIENPAFEMREQAVGAFEVEGQLGNEDEIDVVNSKGCVRGDEAGLPAHNLDDADAVDGAEGLDVRGRDGVNGFGDGGLEAERFLNETQIVIDCFRYTDDGDSQAALLYLFGDGEHALLSAVAADAEEDVDAHLFECIDDVLAALAKAARGAENRAAPRVNLGDDIGIELHNRQRELRQEASIAVTDAGDSADSVAVPQAHNNRADDVVEAGT